MGEVSFRGKYQGISFQLDKFDVQLWSENLCSPQNFYDEMVTRKVIVLGGENFGK